MSRPETENQRWWRECAERRAGESMLPPPEHDGAFLNQQAPAMFSEYLEHGWLLVKIQPGTKGPRTKEWNTEEKCLADTGDPCVTRLVGAGLAHAYSGTCAFDVDDYEGTEAFFLERQLILDDFFNKHDAVHIVSGRQNRGKLLYKLPPNYDPLPSKTFAEGAFELRCGTANNKTVQDALPPTVHPNGNAYEWAGAGDWRNLPELPVTLLNIWREKLQLEKQVTLVKSAPSAEASELEALLKQHDPDCDYETWIMFGMALHHELGDAGFAVWEAWSAEGDKFKDTDDLEQHWQSFGDSANPVTIGSILAMTPASPDEFTDLGPVVDGERDTRGVVYTDPWSEATQKKAEETAERFRFLSLDEMHGRPRPTWLIKDVLPQAAIGTIYGQPAAGKTFVAIDICMALARGHNWRGHDTGQGGALYVAAEDDSGVGLRLDAYVQQHGLDRATLPIKVLPDAPNVLDKEQRAALRLTTIAAAKEVDAKVIVIDTLASVTPGADENAATDMSLLVDYCKTLHRDTGALVLLVHHEGKSSGKGPRGWSGLHGAFEVELYVADVGSGIHEVTVEKIKNAPSGAVFPFRLLPIPLDVFDDDAINSCVIEHFPDRESGDGTSQHKFTHRQRQAYDLLDAMQNLVGIEITWDAAVEEISEQLPLPKTGKRDRRRDRARELLKWIVDRRLARRDGDFVRLTKRDSDVSETIH